LILKGLLLDAGRTLLQAARDGIATAPTTSALKDAFAIRRDDKGRIDLNGRDVWMSEALCEIGQGAFPPPLMIWRGGETAPTAAAPELPRRSDYVWRG
jgi:hypothetical protein